MNGDYTFGTTPTISWYQATKDLKEFCRTVDDSFIGEYGGGLLYYYDLNRGMPECDIESVSITVEQFFQKILEYFMAKFNPDNVIPCGQYDFVCFYPDLTEILGDKEYIYHKDWPNTWCVQIMNPSVLSRDFFEVLAEQIVEQINKICMFDVEYKRVGGVPCLVSSSSIHRICSATQFNEWVNVYNSIIERMCSDSDEILSSSIYYFELAQRSIEQFDLSAEWQGNDYELTELPLFVVIRQVEYERRGDWDCPYYLERRMQVKIDDDSIIHINCNRREICKTYFDIVRSVMRNLHHSVWIGGVRYSAVYDDMEHYVQYLIDNQYEQDGERFVSILHAYDSKMRDALSPSEFYELQLCILVGVENVS